MPDLQKLNTNKERIISTIRLKGPSFPARISREVNIPPLFVAALLSELVSEKRLKISNMKVGSSPIYHIPGQEPQLETFSQHLNFKEREAFSLLKETQILEDDKQEPAIRVALRAIKDFAIPINVNAQGENKLFWKYFTLTADQAKSQIQNIISPNFEPQTPQTQKSEPEPKPEPPTPEPKNPDPTPEPSPKPNPEPEKPKPESSNSNTQQSKLEPIQANPLKTQTKPKKPAKTSKFTLNVREYLDAKDIEVLEELIEKQKEFISKIRINDKFGKQSFLLTAKDKKKVTEDDLIIALQRAQSEKMPSLFLSPGQLDKNAEAFLQHWHNLIKFEKVKF